MATATTSGPQQQVGMPALDLRRLNGTAVLSEGIRTSADLQVAQRGAGANMSVDVSAGSCYIQDDHAGGGGFYHAVWSALDNVVVSAADPTNPRIDRIVVRVRDQFLGDATNAIDLFVVAGTPTAGATLANLNGATAVPGSCLLLANVLVPAASASVITANIGNVASLLKLVGGSSGSRKTTAKAVNTTVAATDLLNGEITIAAGAIGASGVLRLTVSGDWVNNSGATVASPRLQLIFGGTTLLDTGISGTNVSGATRNSWRAVFEIANLGVANSQMTHLDLRMMVNGASTQVQNTFTTGEGILTSLSATGQVIFGEGINPATAVDTTIARLLQLMVINGSASATYETKLLHALIEIV